jgi:hypothetical protein
VPVLRFGRRSEFCADSCRQSAFRNGGYYPSRAPKNAENSPTNSVAKAATFVRGSILAPSDWPIDLLGGNRRGAGLDSALRRRIVASELGRGGDDHAHATVP